jgi:hypothetical protein
MRIEFGQQRSVCDCSICINNCKWMPGFLIPADLERMAPQVAPLQWAEDHLLASPGALVMKGLSFFRIPTLVPKTKTDGSCVNLQPDNRCAIHAIAPFGCAFFDCKSKRGDELSRNGLMTVYQSFFVDEKSLYREIWMHLSERGMTQHPAEALREKMRKELGIYEG